MQQSKIVVLKEQLELFYIPKSLKEIFVQKILFEYLEHSEKYIGHDLPSVGSLIYGINWLEMMYDYEESMARGLDKIDHSFSAEGHQTDEEEDDCYFANDLFERYHEDSMTSAKEVVRYFNLTHCEEDLEYSDRNFVVMPMAEVW